jgi:hypothetical protein
MNSIVRNFVVPACVVALGAAAIFWNVERKRATERKFVEEVKQYQLGANRGDANAEYELGLKYLQGQGVLQDYAQANYWYQKAADQGLAKAKYAIGNSYLYGRGVTQSYSDALVWYRKAADQGDAFAQDAIGLMYYHGNGVPQSYSEAMGWCRKSADQGHAKAEYNVGYFYSRGLGVPKDREEANRWYRKAASQGDEYAQRALGLRFAPLRPLVQNTLALLSLGALLLIWDFVSPKRLFRSRDARGLALGGALGLIQSGLYIYEHSEYCLFPSVWLATTARIATGLLGGVVVSILVAGIWPKALKTLLIASGVLLVVVDISVCAIAHFEMRVISEFIWRFVAVDSIPLGTVFSTAVYLLRKRKEPLDDASEPPIEPGEAPHAV